MQLSQAVNDKNIIYKVNSFKVYLLLKTINNQQKQRIKRKFYEKQDTINLLRINQKGIKSLEIF